MSVSVDVLEQVKAALIAAELSPVAVGQLIEDVRRRESVESAPDRGLAEALRDAYYDDGEHRDLVSSVNPDQWLRMAAAAREFIAGEWTVVIGEPKREPRVWSDWRDIPGDVTVTDHDGDYWRWLGSEWEHSFSSDYGNDPNWGGVRISDDYGPFKEVLHAS